jgi:peptide deformylase
MAEIVQEGDPVLRKVAQPVPLKDIGSARLMRIIKDMQEALAKEEHGVALAAPQIGVSLRLFIIAKRVFNEKHADIEDGTEAPKDDLVFINPEFVRRSRKTSKMSEGCLSVRGIFGMARRHDKASIRAYNEKGERFVWNGSGLVAQIFQHETDHLNGTLFIDHAEELTGEEVPA